MAHESLLHRDSLAAHGLLTETGAMRRGPKQHAREQIDAVQRDRLVAATVASVADVGYSGLTVAQVIERAGVSRRTFYELFKDIEECFLATYEFGIEQLSALVIESYREESSWRESIRAALATMLGFFDVEQGWARLLVVEGLGAGERVLALRVQLIERLALAVAAGHEQAAGKQTLPLAADVVVGGTIWVIYSHLIDRPNESLISLHCPLTAMIMLPYLGNGQAHRELVRD